MFLFVLAYGALVFALLRPDVIRGWREADTQTIALHFVEPGASILRPRIDWGGDGPGFVEAEFQLYPWIVSALLRVTGDVAWPGQIVSLACVVGAALLTFHGLSQRHGSTASVLGMLTLCASRGVVVAATSVQPEALCLLFYSASWYAFLRYDERGKLGDLLLFAGAGALAMLVKPTACHLGISSCLVLLLSRSARLGRPPIWIAWSGMLLLLGAHLLYARGLYLEFGNTFGVLSGGDSKLPGGAQLVSPRVLASAALNALIWGAGPVAALALGACFLLRKNVGVLLSLVLGNAVWTLLALRYTSTAAGNLYHVLGAILGATAVATLADTVAESARRPLTLALATGLAASLVWSFSYRRSLLAASWDDAPAAAGDALARRAAPRSLVVVRSVENARDDTWRTPNNFQDPRVFYRSNTRGYPLPLDVPGVDTIALAVSRGARYYVEAVRPPPSPELERFLAERGTLLETTAYGGRVFELRP